MKKIILLLLVQLCVFSAYAQKEKLSKAINTSDFIECGPVIAPDGKTLYFFSDKEGDDNIYVSVFENGEWSEAQKLPDNVNAGTSNRSKAISQDGNRLYITGPSGSGIYTTDKIGNNEWSDPVPMPMKESYEHMSITISTTGKEAIIYFKQSDSYDLYVIFKKTDGTWSKAQKLPDNINTGEMETCPFLASDDKTLYFSSDGHGGFGNNDLFMCKRLDDTWLKWSDPVNLGESVNTSKFDNFFVIDAAGVYAYTYAYDGNNGDLFRIKLKEEQRPAPVIIVKGFVYDANTKKPISADINYESLTTHTSIGSTRSNKVTGEYQIILPYGDNYGFMAATDGYLSVHDNIDITQKQEYLEIKRDLYLVPVQVGASVQMNNVFFERGTPTLLPSSYPELDRLVLMMKDNPKMEIELSGHTDNTGDPAKNVELSEKRVAVVKQYLVSKGINAVRIVGKGYGGSKPVAPNDSEINKQKNRRVEFVILKY